MICQLCGKHDCLPDKRVCGHCMDVIVGVLQEFESIVGEPLDRTQCELGRLTL
jgi:hypothetical protein